MKILEDGLYKFDEGANNIKQGFNLKTDIIEDDVKQLIEKGVNNDPSKNPFSKIK